MLPISMGKSVKPAPLKTPEESITPEQIELKELKESLADTEPIGSLIKPARTLDQAKALLTFIEAISEKSLRSTVTLTASRGRGKSAALGIAISAAVAYGYSNIFVTSPSPENLKTLFEFIFKGFDALNYEEHLDYDIVQSTNPAFNKAIVRVNIFRQHRQTIQVCVFIFMGWRGWGGDGAQLSLQTRSITFNHIQSHPITSCLCLTILLFSSFFLSLFPPSPIVHSTSRCSCLGSG